MKANAVRTMLFPLPIVLFACASHEIKALAPQPIGAYQLRETTADVTIAAEPLATKEKAEATFTVDLTEQGYAPILAETLPHPNISSRLLTAVRKLEVSREGETKPSRWLESSRGNSFGSGRAPRSDDRNDGDHPPGLKRAGGPW